MTLAKTVTEILTNKTAAVSSYTTLTDCTTVDTDATVSLALEVKVTFDASSNAAAVLKVFDSSNNSTFDTRPCEQFDIAFTAGTAVSQTFSVNPAGRYLKCRVDNGDTVAARTLTAIYIYAHKQVVS